MQSDSLRQSKSFREVFFMDEKNRNISDTFGKYNNSTGKVKNVSSSDWTPISAAGVYESASAVSEKKSRQSQANQQKKKPDRTRQPSDKKASSKGKGNSKKQGLISEGNPSEKKNQKKQTSVPAKNKGAAAEKNKTPSQKSSASRTPAGRDTRADDRKQQKDRENRNKSDANYKMHSGSGKNHDEISRDLNAGKRKKNAIKNAVLIVAVLVFAGFFIGVFCYNHGGLIENIIIEGNKVYTDQQICQAAGISQGKNMLSLREGKIKRSVTKQLPYIKDVVLERQLPDTVILKIKTTVDKYIIASGSGTYTLDSDGKVVSDKKRAVEKGLYYVEGFESQEFSEGDEFEPIEANEERFRLMKEIVTLFEKGGVVDSAVIKLQNTEDVRVIYKDKIAVHLGNCEDLENDIPHASGIVERVAASGKSGYIDMRYDPAPFMPGSIETE